MNSASQGDTSLSASDYPSAIQHFTRALVELPRAPTYYIKRSTAYARLKPADGGPNSHAALSDAEVALHLARERAKRDLILSAQMRRAVALYQLGRYADAEFLFGLVEGKVCSPSGSGGGGDVASADRVKEVMAGGMGGSSSAAATKALEKELPIWLGRVRGKLAKLEEGDERAKVTVEEYPVGVKVPTEKELKRQWESLKAGKVVDEQGQSGGASASEAGEKGSEATGDKDATATATPAAAPAPAPAQPLGKIRHEWYQSHDSVVVTLYAKGIANESVDAELKSDSVSIQFPLPTGSDYAFTLDPLFAPIDVSASKITTFATKIELVLRKQSPGQKWSSLESPSAAVKPAAATAPTSTSTSTATAAAPAPTTTATPPTAPAYPTSSRHGAKDWDKLASTLTAKKPKKTKKPTPAAGDNKDKDKDDENDSDSDNEGSIDSEYGGDPVDSFFKKLYAGADDDTRRAMVKSFVESNGTSLSTNWSEVGKGPVKAYPPSSD